jgi:hypothetical protein
MGLAHVTRLKRGLSIIQSLCALQRRPKNNDPDLPRAGWGMKEYG